MQGMQGPNQIAISWSGLSGGKVGDDSGGPKVMRPSPVYIGRNGCFLVPTLNASSNITAGAAMDKGTLSETVDAWIVVAKSAATIIVGIFITFWNPQLSGYRSIHSNG